MFRPNKKTPVKTTPVSFPVYDWFKARFAPTATEQARQERTTKSGKPLGRHTKCDLPVHVIGKGWM